MFSTFFSKGLTKLSAERDEGGAGGKEFPWVRGRSLSFHVIESGFCSGYGRMEGRETGVNG